MANKEEIMEFISVVMEEPMSYFVATIRGIDEMKESVPEAEEMLEQVKIELLCNFLLNYKEGEPSVDYALGVLDRVKSHLLDMDKAISKNDGRLKRRVMNGDVSEE
ncbi:MAG: hypothetical protein ACOCUR_02135 [Nanoarchaeota archaeon]